MSIVHEFQSPEDFSQADPPLHAVPWSVLPTPVFLPGEFHGQRSLVSST